MWLKSRDESSDQVYLDQTAWDVGDGCGTAADYAIRWGGTGWPVWDVRNATVAGTGCDGIEAFVFAVYQGQASCGREWQKLTADSFAVWAGTACRKAVWWAVPTLRAYHIRVLGVLRG